ncbi:MAG: hypothetical protein U0457_08590 [Candidatus Sericytochromatia bacterium]
MKNIKYLILILTLGFFSCKKEYPKIDESLLKKESEKYSLQLIKGSNLFCEEIKDSNFTPKLINPINIAISNDGETAYVLNAICNRSTFSNSFRFNINNCEKSTIIKRNFIYKITKDKKVEILKINGEPPLSCHLGEEITIDEKNSLYISDPYNKILYKIENEKTIEEIKLPENIYPKKIGVTNISHEGPINIRLKNKKIYFSSIILPLSQNYNLIYELDYIKNEINIIFRGYKLGDVEFFDFFTFFNNDNIFFDVSNNNYYISINKYDISKKQEKVTILNDKTLKELKDYSNKLEKKFKEYSGKLEKKDFFNNVELFKPIIDKTGQLYLVYLNQYLRQVLYMNSTYRCNTFNIIRNKNISIEFL